MWIWGSYQNKNYKRTSATKDAAEISAPHEERKENLTQQRYMEGKRSKGKPSVTYFSMNDWVAEQEPSESGKRCLKQQKMSKAISNLEEVK